MMAVNNARINKSKAAWLPRHLSPLVATTDAEQQRCINSEALLKQPVDQEGDWTKNLGRLLLPAI